MYRLKNILTVFLEIKTVYPNFVPVKKQTTLKVSVLTRKILPPFFGIATIGWIIGGTIWFDNQSNNSSPIAVATSSTVLPSQGLENSVGHFQPLNLFFRKNKAAFVENTELQAYFTNLDVFLLQNPKTQIKITAFHSDTEGSNISKNRLVFITDFLKNKCFNLNQLIFEDKKTPSDLTNTTTITDTDNLKNQRVEIRILTP